MRRWLLCVGLGLVVLPAVAAGQAGGVDAHDPVMMQQGQRFYLFATGAGVPVKTSTDLAQFQPAPPVFKEAPAWTLRSIPGSNGVFWAPDISLAGNEYRLYYSVSTFGSQRSAIGLAVNKTLDPASPDYRWIDCGKVLETFPGQSFNAIDPNICTDEGGVPWLILGSWWNGIVSRKLDAKTGMPASDDTKLYPLASRHGGAVEAPFMVRKSLAGRGAEQPRSYYYLFLSYDQCCKGVESTYNIQVVRSEKITGPFVDKQGKPALDGHATPLLASSGTVRGPGHCAVMLDVTWAGQKRDLLVYHYYDAADAGKPKLQIRQLNWGEDDHWPVAGEVIKRSAGSTTVPAGGR